MSAIKYLKEKEWSMGNGQCPECCGAPEKWFGHPCYMTPDTIGHEKDCELAASLKDLGETPLMKGGFCSETAWEPYITDGGIFSTRHKTEHGCPKYKTFSGKWQGIRDKALLSALSR